MAGLFIPENLHYAGVIEVAANGGFAFEAAEKGGVPFHLGVGNLDRHRIAGAQVPGSKNRSHSAACGNRINQIVIDPVTRMERRRANSWRRNFELSR